MAFCQRYGLRIPILLAPMAGSCPVSLAVAVADAGGMGAMGALLSSPDAIANWAAEFRSRSLGPLLRIQECLVAQEMVYEMSDRATMKVGFLSLSLTGHLRWHQ